MIGRESAAAIFLVTIAMVYDVISATNSSPQTTEINAKARGETLMKWVHVGLGQAVAFMVIAAIVAWQTGGAWWAVLLAGVLAITALYCQYIHALKVGLGASEPGTESY